MRASFSTLAVATGLASLVAAIPQGATSTSARIFPGPQASGCASTFQNGASFQIGILNATAALAKRQAPAKLMLTLVDGVLTDNQGGFGYISSSDQLQFDNPIQAGALITDGWSACPNGTLALASALFYECLTTTASGSFFNLYDQPIGDQCDPAFLMIISDTPAVTTTGPTTITATQTIQPVSQLSDGQPVVSTASSTITTTMTIGISVGTGVPPPFNATTSGLLPFNSGSSLQPFIVNGGMTFYASLVAMIGLVALIL